jgi:hypothetical protein
VQRELEHRETTINHIYIPQIYNYMIEAAQNNYSVFQVGIDTPLF